MRSIFEVKGVPQISEEGFWEFKSTHAATVANQNETSCLCDPTLRCCILLPARLAPFHFKETLDGKHLLD
jgi:hypothetical protein